MTLRLLTESKNTSESSEIHPQSKKSEINPQTEQGTAGSSDSKSPQPKASRICTVLTKAGKPCRAAATETGACFFHANPQKAAQLGAIGGRKHGRTLPEVEPLPRLNSAAAICSSIAQLAEEVHAGKLDSKVAGSFVQLMRLLLQALPAADLEQQRKHLDLPDDFCLLKTSTDKEI